LKRSGSTNQNDRCGFALIEVLAAVALTAAFAAIVLPFCGRLIDRWWHGEAAIDNADAWMQVTARLTADLAQAIAMPAAKNRNAPLLFRATRDSIVFVAPPRNVSESKLQLVAYVIERTSSSSSIVNYATTFNPSLVDIDPRALGPATAAFTGSFDLAFAAVGSDGSRPVVWSDRKDLPRWIELTTRPLGRNTAPTAPIILPIAARPQTETAANNAPASNGSAEDAAVRKP
jgi:prepilin-type N-terminal cleavage/methylation domain-containing protein